MNEFWGGGSREKVPFFPFDRELTWEMLRFSKLASRFAQPSTKLLTNSFRKPIARSMTAGGQARLTGPVGPISLALLVVGGGSAYWYAPY
jgi:hypothetical protein